jgi:hypothetical protein
MVTLLEGMCLYKEVIADSLDVAAALWPGVSETPACLGMS